MESLEDVEFLEKKGSKFYYRLHMTKEMREASLDELDLSVRSSNCLHRAGYFKIGELVDALAAGLSLNSIRNLGKTCAREIMEHLFLYQYGKVTKEKREIYLLETVVYNLQKQMENG
jgi:DNA-directed RNA polymerase alpha subunit